MVFGFLRGVVWERDAVEGAPEPTTSLDELSRPLRTASAEPARRGQKNKADVKRRAAIVRLLAAMRSGSTWRAVGGDAAGARVSCGAADLDGAGRRSCGEVRQRLQAYPGSAKDLVAAQGQALRSVLNEGAVAGYGQKALEKATRKASMSFVARNIATLLALFTATAPESALMFTAADEQIAAHYGMTTSKLNQVGPWLTAVSPVVGLLLLDSVGDRMITTMRWITLAAAVGVTGLVVAGLGGGSGLVGLVVSTVALAVWDAVMGGPARARFDKYFPVVDEMQKAHRAAQLQSSFKFGQLLLRQVYLFGFLAIGVTTSYLVMTAVALVGMVVILAFLRGGTLKAQPRAPPKLSAAARGVFDQIRGSRGGVRRWLAAIPVGTVLTGLPMYALGGGLVGIMLRLVIAAGGDTAWLIGSTLVTLGATYLSFVPRVLAWLLGTPPIWGKLNGLLGTGGKGGPVDQARVLVGLGFLGAVMLLPTSVLLYLVPTFWTLMALTSAGAIITGWARTPHNMWTAGSAIATLVNAAKGFAVMIGILIGTMTVAGPAEAAVAAVEAGAAREVVLVLVRQAMLNLVGVTAALVVLNIVWARAVRTYRVAPWSLLREPLLRLSPSRGEAILDAVRDAGFGDVGSLAAVFLDHPPAGSKAAAAQQRRRNMVEILEEGTKDTFRPLDADEIDILRRALAEMFELGTALQTPSATATPTTLLEAMLAELFEKEQTGAGSPGSSTGSTVDVAGLLAALRAAGISTPARAVAIFLDGAGPQRAAAVRVLDPATGELRPLTAEETGHIRDALTRYRETHGKHRSRVSSAGPGGTGSAGAGTGSGVVEGAPAPPARAGGRRGWAGVVAGKLRWMRGGARDPPLTATDLTRSIEQREQRLAAMPDVERPALDQDRWNDTVTELRAVVDRLDEHAPGSTEHTEQARRARELLAALDALLGPDSPGTSTLHAHPLATVAALAALGLAALPAHVAAAIVGTAVIVAGLTAFVGTLGVLARRAGAYPWVARAAVVALTAAALVVLLSLPASAVSQSAPSAVAGGWLPGAVAGALDALLTAGPAVAGVVLVARGLAAWRSRGLRKQLSDWAGIGRAGRTGKGVAGVDVVRLLAWAERVIETGRAVSGGGALFVGFTAEELAGGVAGMGLVPTRDPWVLLGLADRLGKRKHQHRVLEVLAELAVGPEPLVVRVVDADGVVRWRASELLMQLLARGPPEFAAALLADPKAVLRVEGLRRLSGLDLGRVVFDAARRAVWAQTGAAAARGWRAWVPGLLRGLVTRVAGLFGRGPVAGLRGLVAPVRAARAAIAEHKWTKRPLVALQRLESARNAGAAAGSWRARAVAAVRVLAAWLALPRTLRFAWDMGAERAALEQQLAGFDDRQRELQADLTRALRRAWSEGARDGFAKKDVDRAAQNAGYGGEALLHLVGKVFKGTIPAKVTEFFAVYSAATIAAYGFLYQLHHLPLLVAVTSVSTLAGLLHLVLSRSHLGRPEKVRHAVVATALTSINTLAATAVFLGWPDMSTGSAIVSAALGVAATVIWIWTIRGPPGSGPSGPGSAGSGLRGAVTRVFASVRGRLAGAGSVRSPPADADGLRVAVARLRERVGADPGVWSSRQREAHGRLFGVLSRVLGELDAGAGGARAEELLGEAFAVLVEFDRWVPAGERARWRAQLRRSHRWAWLPVAGLAIGLSAAGVFGTPVLGGPVLFVPGFVGYLVGLAVVGPWWGYLERRSLAQVSLGLTGVGFGVFALSGAVPGLAMVAAVLLGFAGAGYSPVQSRAGEWVRETVQARRDNGESVRLSGGVTALVTLGFAGVASVLFVVLKPLLGVSPMAAGLFGVGLSVVAVAGLRWAMPGELPDRERAQIKRVGGPVRTVVATTIKFVGDAVSTLRRQYRDADAGRGVGRLVALVAVVMGAANLVSGAFDAFWREGLAQNAGGASLLNVLSFGLVGSGVLLVGLLVPADLRKSRAGPDSGGKRDLLNGTPGLFLLLMAGALSGGVVAAAVTALTGSPLIGIAVGVYGNAVSVTGMGLGVNAILDRYLPENQRASALTAVNLVRALGNIAGAQLAAGTSAGAIPLLPAGWTGVVLQNVVPGLVALGAGILLWRRTAGPPPSGPSATPPSTPKPSTPGVRGWWRGCSWCCGVGWLVGVRRGRRHGMRTELRAAVAQLRERVGTDRGVVAAAAGGARAVVRGVAAGPAASSTPVSVGRGPSGCWVRRSRC